MKISLADDSRIVETPRISSSMNTDDKLEMKKIKKEQFVEVVKKQKYFDNAFGVNDNSIKNLIEKSG